MIPFLNLKTLVKFGRQIHIFKAEVSSFQIKDPLTLKMHMPNLEEQNGYTTQNVLHRVDDALSGLII